MKKARFHSKMKSLMMQKIGKDGSLITQQAVADETKLAYGTVTRWYHDDIERLDPEIVAAFLRYFDCGFSDLVEIEY